MKLLLKAFCNKRIRFAVASNTCSKQLPICHPVFAPVIVVYKHDAHSTVPISTAATRTIATHRGWPCRTTPMGRRRMMQSDRYKPDGTGRGREAPHPCSLSLQPKPIAPTLRCRVQNARSSWMDGSGLEGTLYLSPLSPSSASAMDLGLARCGRDARRPPLTHLP